MPRAPLSPALASMTGFARDRGEANGISWVWEVKSVNGRGLDVRFRLPPGWDGVEPALKDAAQAKLKRGSISAGLSVRRDEQAARPMLDRAALEAALAIVAEVQALLPAAPPPPATALLSLPGVMRAASEEEPDEALLAARAAAVTESFARALAALESSRRAEGARIGAVLAAKLDEIEGLVASAEADAATQPEAIRDRLVTALRALADQSPALTEDRIAAEAALLASRADVREEIDRLHAHIAAARALMVEGTLVGRRLDFLTQEFNREANTLCSKAASRTLTATGLALKAAIEQFREQVQNLE
ncbi:YicC/YloC family endoribonuclease [Elioraea rosea]|uniref:YicC/YloC family endoribonuclease n=1 Tax=Elioraea rosea TaxID=2492390 RepID=UPI001EF70993|nr:YicC/YloC family endoribonuclease [Elioraea rosea]